MDYNDGDYLLVMTFNEKNQKNLIKPRIEYIGKQSSLNFFNQLLINLKLSLNLMKSIEIKDQNYFKKLGKAINNINLIYNYYDLMTLIYTLKIQI